MRCLHPGYAGTRAVCDGQLQSLRKAAGECMTSAIKLVKKQKLTHHVHEYVHGPASAPCRLEAAEKLGIAPQQVFKTLVITLDAKGFGCRGITCF
jgi:hypothetical protein